MQPERTASTDGATGSAKARCRACQLQLCKGREQLPHAHLTEIDRNEGDQSTRYTCASCDQTLIRSGDFAKAGWRKDDNPARAARAFRARPSSAGKYL